jgi:uncharacterized membrane protein YkoI
MHCLKKYRTCLLALSLLLVSLPPAAAPVSRTEGSVSALMLSQAHDGISADRAAVMVREATGGRILSVDKQEKKDVTVYRVKVLMADGRVRVIQVNATTGQISG